MMTHDMELQLPEMLFDSATLKVSPRGFEGSGAIVKLELLPAEQSLARNINGEGRIFIFKKIKQYLKNKLMMAFIAAVLIINLIKFKVLFLLPMMMGAGPAKKFGLKILLFFFPALSHIFKLCHYYHSNYHSTKFVHHQHHIKHLHHTVPHVSYDSPHPPVELDHPPVELDHPPQIPYELQLAHDPPHKPQELPIQPAPYDPSHTEYDYLGPAFGAPTFSFDTHRNSYVHHPKPEDINEINEWGLGVTGNSAYSYPTNPYIAHHPHVRPGSSKPGNTYKRFQSQATSLATQHGPLILPPSKNKHLQQAALIRAAQIKEAQKLQADQLRLQSEQKLLAQKFSPQHLNQQIIQKIDSTQYDAFYSPILTKIDAVLEKLGHIDAGCKERILCAMYKNPMKYSPHSNLVSAELSRDPEELQKPTVTNTAVIKFYRYVQAARDGQDGRECARLYPLCPQIQEPA